MAAIARFTLTSLDGVDRFGAVPEASLPRFNIAPLQRALICTARGLATARWGLLPPWRGHGGKRDPHVLHAPLDAIDQVPLLRNAFKAQRCLVLADGFFVWRRSGKKPQPLWVHPAPDPHRPGSRSRLAAFAGIATTHKDDGQPSFALIVSASSPVVAPLHTAIGTLTGQSTEAMPDDTTEAMPVIVAPDKYEAWLTAPSTRALDALTAAPEGWRAEPVSTRVNSIEHDDPACIESLTNPAQGLLF